MSPNAPPGSRRFRPAGRAAGALILVGLALRELRRDRATSTPKHSSRKRLSFYRPRHKRRHRARTLARVMAGITGPGYPGAGSTIGTAMTFGFIAGREAARIQ